MSQESNELPKTLTLTDTKRTAREQLLIAEQSVEGGVKILPGDKWAIHYPGGPEKHRETLQKLLDGNVSPKDVASSLKPDALIFDATEIGPKSLDEISARVRDVSLQIAHYDYQRFANFVAGFRQTGMSPDMAEAIYEGISKNRVRKIMMDAFGHTGRKEIEAAIKNELDQMVAQVKDLTRVNKVLEALKTQWASQDVGLIGEEAVDNVIAQLSADERSLFESLQGDFRGYVNKGSEVSFGNLTQKIRENVSKIEPPVKRDEPSESMQELEKELEQYKDQVDLPGTPGDPAIPPEDQDEYHTPTPSEHGEKGKPSIFFEITPKGASKSPIVGYYQEGRKSYYDVDAKTWSKKKNPVAYSTELKGDERQAISGTVDSGIKAIPIPNSYALDSGSLTFSGTKPEILRDQNGCFYIKTSGVTTFSVDFLKESRPFVSFPIQEDSASLYSGSLSLETEAALARFTGSPVEKAEKARAYLLAHHFYPGGGDLQTAQALQFKLRKESTGNNYIQNLDKSEYLECYSANTLFIAMLRRLGVPARLVNGHKIEGAFGGKAVIDSNSGHAWAEIWDGRTWRRIDATPNAKPEDMKEEQKEKGDGSPTQEAQDEGIKNSQGEGANKQDKNEPGKASDKDVKDAESQLQDAQNTVDQAQVKKQELDQKVENTESFKNLEELKQEIEKADLFEDIKEDLKEKIEAKEQEIKDEMREKLEEMTDDGFMDEKRRDELEKALKEADLKMLDALREQIEREGRIYDEYGKIKEDVMPSVEEWYKYFVQRLPKEVEIEQDEDSLTRQGAFNRHSVMKPRNLLFGTVKNPRVIKPSIKPKFLASTITDISGSMGGEKLNSARKLLVFYNELFTRISSEYGYIRYANYVFSDSISELKTFDQEYDSPTRYSFSDGKRSTIKVRLMEKMQVSGGTNMLDALKRAAKDLNKETFEHSDYASALYFIGDGEDSNGNSERIKQFLKLADSERGFGEHLLSAILLGDERLRQQLSNIFGEDHTVVASNFESLIEKAMEQFDADIQEYLKNKTI